MARRPTAPPRPSPSEPGPGPTGAGTTRGAGVALAGLVLARAAVFLALGPGFVSDDWSLAGAMHLDGHQGRFILESRPGSWAVFTAVYGIAGLHPVAVFVLVTALYLTVVLALRALLVRFLAPATALIVTAVWVVLPTHTTITVWGATTNSLVGMTLALLGLLALSHGRWALAAAGMAASVLSYELSTPILLLGALLLPSRWQREASTRPVSRERHAAVFAVVAAAALWSATHSVYDATFVVPNPVVYASAHFGSGLFATASAPAILRFGVLTLVLVLVLAALIAWWGGERDRESGPGLVAAGLVVMAAGAWITLVLPIGSHGVVDRLYAVSSIGSALVLVGLYRYARDRRPTLATAGAVGLVGVCLVGQFVALRSWSDAGADAVTLMRHLEREHPHAARQRFVVGPTPPYRNGVVGVSGGHGKWTQWVWFGVKDGNLRTAEDAGQFVPRPGEVAVAWNDVLAESGR